MDHQPQSRRESLAGGSSFSSTTFRSETEPRQDLSDLDWPFGKIEGIDKDDLREAAYDIFFTACRSPPGSGGKNALTYGHLAAQDGGDGGGIGGIGNFGGRTNGLGLVATSKVKRALGLKTVKRILPNIKKPNSNPSSPRVSNSSNQSNGVALTLPLMRLKRPLTSAEIMRQQMRVSEQNDNRLRKTLMRTLVGQMGRRVETIIIPLELLRHLKPSEFNNVNEYHLMQKRQLKILEAGLLLYPSVQLDISLNPSAIQLQDVIRGSETKPIDTTKNSETMRMLLNSVVTLSLRSTNGSTADVCHWADGFPMNIHLYICLLQSIFDIKDETSVLDEVDELLELIKKTWSTLGINKFIHNVCFMWVLFQQYVLTAQIEQDLLCASLTMLTEVANDVKKADRRDIVYIKILSSTVSSMLGWSEKRLLDYHDSFQKGTAGLMENLLPFSLSASRILDEDISNLGKVQERGDSMVEMGNKVNNYIRSSVRNAFAKILSGTKNIGVEEEEEASEALIQLAKETEDLAIKEKENFSPILKRWHPVAAGVAAMTLHNSYGAVLKQYINRVSTLTNEAIGVLQRAGKLEKNLTQIVIEDSVDCEEVGKVLIKEMVAYDVDSIILKLLKSWIYERLKAGKKCLGRAKETETWNPKSKTEPYAQSAVDVMKLVHQSVDNFFEIPIGISDDLVQDLVEGLELLVLDYTSFISSCGSKQSYIPALPPLTRCNQYSKFTKIWRKASPCRSGRSEKNRKSTTEGDHPRPSTSRGTQRLYIRLNTLQYLLSYVHSLDKSLSLARRQNPLPSSRARFANNCRHLSASQSYFDLAQSTIITASENVAKVAAYRLIFLDSNSVFYESLYAGDVANARIRPALRILKQNLSLLTAMLMDQAQPLAVKEVMKATFDSFLMVLLAGGVSRTFTLSDHEMIEEDFESLKRAFCSCGDGLISEEVVEREAETVEGVLGLMGQSTEQLVEDFSIMACEVSGLGIMGEGQKVPMPPTTGRWNRADPNTILRVLCHRNDRIANSFLKKTFQLAKRK